MKKANSFVASLLFLVSISFLFFFRLVSLFYQTKVFFNSIMVRLTPEVIEAAPQYLNPVGQYELSLRGN